MSGVEGKEKIKHSRQVCSAGLWKGTPVAHGAATSWFFLLPGNVFAFTFSLSLSFPQSFRAEPPLTSLCVCFFFKCIDWDSSSSFLKKKTLSAF